MPRFLELEGGGGVEGNLTFWINGITIVKGWMIACGLRKLFFDEDLSENHVKVIIYGTAKSQIMSIWIYDHWLKQFLMDVIFSHCFLPMITITCWKMTKKKQLMSGKKLMHDC